MIKPDVLIVTRNLPPLIGGMERLLWHAVDELRKEYRVHVVGPAGCIQTLPHDVLAKDVQVRPLFFFFLRASLEALKTALRYRPHVVFAGSGITAPIVWIIARLFRVRCIVYLHGLDLCAEHPVYRYIWVPFFRYFNSVIVNSNFTKNLAIAANIPRDRITIVNPGVEIPIIIDGRNRAIAYRFKNCLGHYPVMLYVGRITPRKGLLYFVENILHEIIVAMPNSILIVIGDDANDALQGVSDERSRVSSVLKEKKLEASVRFLGSCSDDELSSAYFASDVLVFPVQPSSHDVEGFGMVAIEAAAHGLPTVAFSVGGVPDAISDGVCGVLIPPGNNTAFAQAIINYATQQRNSRQIDACRKFAERFRWNEFGGQLREIFKIRK